MSFKLSVYSRTRAYAVKRPVSAHAGYTGPRHRDDPACYKDELEVQWSAIVARAVKGGRGVKTVHLI